MMRATLDRCKKIVGTPGGLSIPTEECDEPVMRHLCTTRGSCWVGCCRAVHTTEPWVTNRLNLERQCVSALSAVKRFLVLTGTWTHDADPIFTHRPRRLAQGILIFRSQTRSSR